MADKTLAVIDNGGLFVLARQSHEGDYEPRHFRRHDTARAEAETLSAAGIPAHAPDRLSAVYILAGRWPVILDAVRPESVALMLRRGWAAGRTTGARWSRSSACTARSHG